MSIDRRTFLSTSLQTSCALVGTGIALGAKKLPPKSVRIGLIADLHHQFVKGGEKRLETFLAQMEKDKPAALVQLGDFTFPNAGGKAVAEQINGASENCLHVIGNHDLDLSLTRKHCIDAWGMPSAYYRRDIDGLRFLVLDGNEKGSPDHKGGYPSYVGEKQLEWLKAELVEAELPVIIISHQPLAGPSAINNATAVQKVISAHGDKVLVALNGHSHLDAKLEVGNVPYIHLNSASYYWVGGKQRTLFYRDPLFATLTIDPEAGKAILSGKTSAWDGKTPEEIGYFKGKKEALRDKVAPSISDLSLRL